MRKLEISFEEILDVSWKSRERGQISLWREVMALNSESPWHAQSIADLTGKVFMEGEAGSPV